MQLKFKTTGSTAGLVTWLKGFKDIDPSLLIEVDIKSQVFIAKGFPNSRAIVKYSKISFDDAGLECFGITDNNGETFDWDNCSTSTDGRIKIGIYEILNKVIDVFSMFSETDHELLLDFDICEDIKYVSSQDSSVEYQTTTITLKSASLTMAITCSQLSEIFVKLDDDTYLNVVCNIGNPATYSISLSTLANLSKISSVFSTDRTHDAIKFYSKTSNGMNALYAYDESNKTFDYLLGYLENGATENVATVIYKENFMNATKGLSCENLTMTLDTAGASRIRIDAEDAKIIVAAVQN